MESRSRHKLTSLPPEANSTDNDSKMENLFSLMKSHWVYKLLLRLSSSSEIDGQHKMSSVVFLVRFFCYCCCFSNNALSGLTPPEDLLIVYYICFNLRLWNFCVCQCVCVTMSLCVSCALS